MSNNGTDLSPNRVTPVVDFTSQDFDGINADLTTYAQANFSDRWTDFNPNQFAVVFKELVAYLGDLVSYQINSGLRETIGASIIRRDNLTNWMKPFELAPGPAEAATVDLTLTLDVAGSYPFTINPEDHLFSNGNDDDEVFFHPSSVTIVSAFSPTITVNCTEGEYFNGVLLGVSTGAPNQRLQFPQTLINQNSIVVTVGGLIWTSVRNFINSDRFDQAYKVIENDSAETFAIFGEGSFGIVPANTAEIRATFHNGGGRRGNLAPTLIDTIVTANAAILSVNNPLKSSGGQPPQTLKEARNSIPNSFSTLKRAVSGPDYRAFALLVPGVAKAIGVAGSPAGSRKITTIIAPAGGGEPSTVLRNAVLTALAPAKMVTNRVRSTAPVYRALRLEVLLHVNQGFKAVDVEANVRRSITNDNGAGVLDFTNQDFRGVDSDGQLVNAQTPIQDHFATLKSNGLDRAEILRLDVEPLARAKTNGNSGSGTIAKTSIITSTRQRRRRYLINLTSATTFEVFEIIIGLVSVLSDTVLTDDTKIFEDEGVSNYVGFTLTADNEDDATQSAVLTAVGQDITVAAGSSLFSLTEPGAEYSLFNPVPSAGTVGTQFSNADGSVKFTVTAGTDLFINGDSFTLDIYPVIGDIRLLNDEYPELSEADFITRTSGGK